MHRPLWGGGGAKKLIADSRGMSCGVQGGCCINPGGGLMYPKTVVLPVTEPYRCLCTASVCRSVPRGLYMCVCI